MMTTSPCSGCRCFVLVQEFQPHVHCGGCPCCLGHTCIAKRCGGRRRAPCKTGGRHYDGPRFVVPPPPVENHICWKELKGKEDKFCQRLSATLHHKRMLHPLTYDFHHRRPPGSSNRDPGHANMPLSTHKLHQQQQSESLHDHGPWCIQITMLTQ